MQSLMGVMRKAISKYNMIQDGDRIAVGVSGGKDSMAMLTAMAHMRRYIGIDYKLFAVAIDMGFGGNADEMSGLREYCKSIDVPLTVKQTNIGELVFSIRNESNPCSLCARTRRGSLHDEVVALGCNKVALGHHMDDAVETFLMNLFIEARVGCFSPVTYLSRKDITMIRPMVLVEESEIKRAVQSADIPVFKSKCPVDGTTKRQEFKEFIIDRETLDPGFKKRIFGAMTRGNIDGF